MAILASAEQFRFPYDEGSRIHIQGPDTFLAVGIDEIGKLPLKQRDAVFQFLHDSGDHTLYGSLHLGSFRLFVSNGGSPFVASFDQDGKTNVYVGEWIYNNPE